MSYSLSNNETDQAAWFMWEQNTCTAAQYKPKELVALMILLLKTIEKNEFVYLKIAN
jgi:hypothetical protein